MRMWMISPSIMCNNHLLGEHRETHMIIGHLQKKKHITGYVLHNLMQIKDIKKRHDVLVKEMQRRGYNNHKTPIDINITNLIQYLTKTEKRNVNITLALADLLARCHKCNNNFTSLKKQMYIKYKKAREKEHGGMKK